MKIQRIVIALTAANVTLFLVTLAEPRPTGAQATEPVLRARALELVDEHGRTRASLKLESNGEAVFRLFDQNGTIRVKLGAGEDGSGLLLANDATEPGVHFLAKSTGSSLKLRNKDGRERDITP